MPRAILLLTLTLACSACGLGGDDPYSVDDVVAAFAAEKIPLVERIGGQPNSVLVSSFAPDRAAEECADDLSVSIFRGSSDLDDHFRRVGLNPGKNRYVVSDEDGEPAVGLVRRNVVASIDVRSECFSERRIAAAMDGLR